MYLNKVAVKDVGEVRVFRLQKGETVSPKLTCAELESGFENGLDSEPSWDCPFTLSRLHLSTYGKIVNHSHMA